jgi:hypothetical protein
MNEFKFDLTEVLKSAARVAQTAIDLQVPVDTGKLKKEYRIVVQDEQLFMVLSDDIEYGVFTDYGTGPYYIGGYGEGLDAGLFEGYRKGEGGIQAQKWSSLPIEVETEIALMIEEEIARQADMFLEQAINAI